MSKIIEELLATSNINDTRRILEQHPELLSDEADSIMNTLAKNIQNKEIIDLIQTYRDLLILCREIGIDQAFEEISSSSNKTSEDIQMLLKEILSLSKPQDIPRKIILLQRALSLAPRPSSPRLWGAIQEELGNTLVENPHGNREDNIDHAIEHYMNALEVYTQKESLVEWAEIQNNLAAAYYDRIRGDKAENLEQAIKHYNQALEVRTRNDFPVDWAMSQNNLAVAYWSRIRGDRAINIEKAIEHLNQALEVRTHNNLPVQWAMTQNNLANAYLDRILGDKEENIEEAIEHLNQALKVFTQKDFPVDWAGTQNNLATAYSDRIRGEKADNFEKAIEHLNQALEVRKRNDFPMQWAMSQNNLGLAYKDRILGDKAENIEQAIEHFNETLEVYTRNDFPTQWALAQNNLANAYNDRILGDKEENIEKAIEHLKKALKIYKLESMPHDFRRVCRLLGDLYLFTDQWGDAAESYKNAIKAGDLVFRSDLSVGSKTLEVKENAYVYRNAALAACRMKLTKEALLVLEKGKVRLLREALRLKVKQPLCVPDEEWIKYEQVAERYNNATKPSNPMKDNIKKEIEAQQALEELDTAVKVVQSYYPEFQKEIKISDILSISDKETALLTFCITDKGSIGFVITELRGVQSVDIPDFKKKDLNSLLVKTNEKGSVTGGWIADYLNYLNASETKRYDAFQAWQQTLNDVLSIIGSKFLSPLLAKLPHQIKRLIILPSGGLFLLPLHAAPFSDGQLLCQHYCISYAPSIPLLKGMQNNMATKGNAFYAVINPEEDPALVFSGCEGQVISKIFESCQVNIGKTGTKATVLYNIPGRAYLHFSCHGSYNWNDPPQSGLFLAGGRTLSLGDLQNSIVDLSSTRLVTLSACETGITDILKGSADEFVGLPAGFMLAGVPCVVSSLWSVPDISTALLMERFYSNHVVEGMDISLALQEAQLWVRDLTSGQVANFVDKCYHSGKWEGKSKDFIEKYREHYIKMAKESPNEKPFYNPYYWAAFTVYGI